MLQQRPPGLRRNHALARPQQERGAQRLLHIADLRARGSERGGWRALPRANASGLHHMPEQAQVRKIEAHRLPSDCTKAAYLKCALQARHGRIIFAPGEATSF